MLAKYNISISLVIYRPKWADIEKLFRSFTQAKDQDLYSLRCYVIDNLPTHENKTQINKLCSKYALEYEYIPSNKNLGYGAGHNLVLEKINSDFHIVTNPDIKVDSNALVEGLKLFESRENIVFITPGVKGKNGERHHLCKQNPSLFNLFLRRFIPNRFKKLFQNYMQKFEYRDHDYDKEILNVPYCTGCFMWFRSKTFKELKGFDERFFMYMEDADISRRSLALGETLYAPQVKVTHGWEKGSHKDKKLRNMAIKSAFQYWWKWGKVF